MVEGTVGLSWLPSLCLRELAAVLLAVVGGLLYLGVPANALLPDGRAWEMVSSPGKNGADIAGIEGDNGGGIVQASIDGQTITYVSFGSFASPQSAPIGSQYLAARQTGGSWLTRNISLPTSSQAFGFGGGGIPYRAFSSDLTRGLVFGGARGGASGQLPVENPPLPGTNAPAGYEDLYLNDFLSSSMYSLLTNSPNVPPEDFSLQFLGSTPDLSHIVIRSPNALTQGAIETPGISNLYEWSKGTGQFQSINVLPSGLPEAAHFIRFGGNHFPSYGQAISDDGSRAVWTAESGPSALYVRLGLGTGQPPQTVQADAPAGDGEFLAASSDDRKIFFADRHKLTTASTDGGGRGLGDLYQFAPEAVEGGRLVDLTPDHVDVRGAEVQGVLGASEDGTSIYFVANGVLADNEGVFADRAAPGDCTRGQLRPENSEDLCNLYLWQEGKGVRFIARLSGDDESESSDNFNGLGAAFDWARNLGLRTTRVSRDGTRVVFMSERSLSGYDNTVSTGTGCGVEGKTPLPKRCQEVFLYDANANRLSCVSCNPNGTRPSGPSGISGATEFSAALGQYESRVLSEGGSAIRVFFDSADALAPQDTNGLEDVYEYEAGRDYLVSDGSSSDGASFLDASLSGDDVFFLTRAQLIPQDTDRSVDLYDARAPHVSGEAVGFATPSAPFQCEGENCRPLDSSAPTSNSLSSVLFQGLGNVPAAMSESATKPKPKKANPKRKGAKKKAKGRKMAAIRRVGRAKGGKRS